MLPIPMHGEPSVVASSHQEKHHHSPPSVAIHIGEHRGGLPQQTQTAELGLQTDLIRVLDGLPQTSGLAHFGGLRIQRESSDSQVHDLGTRLQATAIDTLDYYWDPETWLFPPVPPHSSTIGGGPKGCPQKNVRIDFVSKWAI